MDERFFAAGKYQQVAPEAVERIWRRAQAHYKKPKDAEKAARRALHQMTGAFMTADQLKRARECLVAYQGGDHSALGRALALHASTRERLDGADALYEGIFALTGVPGRVLDLACGLNPLYLGAAGLSVVGLDVHGGVTALINAWAEACGWDIGARCADLIDPPDLPPTDLALMFKLMPVLEAQKKGVAMRLLSQVPCPYAAVSFPMRTLGGRAVGMESHYSNWFEQNMPDSHEILGRLVAADELCYVARRRTHA